VRDPSPRAPHANGLINGLVYQRPIAWTSTVARDGTRNLAPFSFFNAFSFHPYPTLGVGPGARRGIDKGTLANIRATGEFVVNLVSAELAETANHCSAELPGEVDEWDLAAVQSAPSGSPLFQQPSWPLSRLPPATCVPTHSSGASDRPSPVLLRTTSRRTAAARSGVPLRVLAMSSAWRTGLTYGRRQRPPTSDDCRPRRRDERQRR
jgi:hypothetical protein